MLTTESSSTQECPRGPYRQELLYALRRSQDTDTAIWNTAPGLSDSSTATGDGRFRAEHGPSRQPAGSFLVPCCRVHSSHPPAEPRSAIPFRVETPVHETAAAPVERFRS